MNGAGWFALRVGPQKEFAVEEILKRRGLRAFCPTETKWKRVGRRKTPHNYPMLTRYVFASGADPWDIIRAYRDRGLVQGVVGFDGRPAMISEEAIQRLARISGGALPTKSTSIHKSFTAGDKVRFAYGPWNPHEIVEVSKIAGETGVVLMEMFGTVREVKVKLDQLEAA
jgi:transcription antitermination factor NusG